MNELNVVGVRFYCYFKFHLFIQDSRLLKILMPAKYALFCMTVWQLVCGDSTCSLYSH